MTLHDRRYIAHGILVRDGAVLLLHRREGRYLGGQWDVPGGTVEADEAPADTVVREFAEETGLRVRVERQLMRQNNIDTEGRPIEFITVTFLVSPVGSADAVVLGDEHDEYQWVEMSSFPKFEVVWHLPPVVNVLLDRGGDGGRRV